MSSSSLFGLTTAGAAALPPALLDALASLLGAAQPTVWGGRRAGHRAAVRRILGASDRASETASRAAVSAHLRFVAEFLAVLGGRTHAFEGGEALQATPPGRGRLITLVHEGNWIAAGRHLAPLIGPIHTVAGVQLGARWQQMIDATLRAQGIEVHHAPLAARKFLRVLSEGGSVALHLDGDQGRGADGRLPGVRAAAALAHRADPVVFHLRTVRTSPGRFRLEPQRIAPPIGGVIVGPRAWEATFAALVRSSVARAPGEWMIFRP